MPILKNARHERFAQLVASGKSATEAYGLAGYKEDRTAASRLSTNVNVRSRITELQSAAAKKAGVTRETIKQMLEEDRQGAMAANQWGAARAASESLGKLYGLYVDKQERDVTHRYIARLPEKTETIEEWHAKYAPKPNGNGKHPVQ